MKSSICVCVFNSDGASTVSSESESRRSMDEMADAIRINKEIQQTGMYFA